jgi:hypothetical protein
MASGDVMSVTAELACNGPQVLCQSEEFGLAVVDLAKEPLMRGSLASYPRISGEIHYAKIKS